MHSMLLERLQERNLARAKESLNLLSPDEAVAALREFPATEHVLAFRLLDKQFAIEVFELLSEDEQVNLLEAMTSSEAADVLAELDLDDQARLVDEAPAAVAKRLLAALSAADRARVGTLLSYPADSAGRIANPHYLAVRPHVTAREALATIRNSHLDAEDLGTVFVIDVDRRYLGLVSVVELVKAPESQQVADLARLPDIAVATTEDAETAARLPQRHDLTAVPVVDSERRMVGIIHTDDAIRVLEEGTSEDLARTGGSEPLSRPYLLATPFHLARKRAVWLLLLGVAAVLTVNVLAVFEETLEAVVALALFFPLLIDTGGNSGSQAATVVIRAMSVGEVRLRDFVKVVWREAQVGLMLGLMLGAIALPVIWTFFGLEFAVIVASSLALICLWASFVGGMLPMVAKRVGIDPAVVSAPLITTLVDATGLIIYFLIAMSVLGL
ncbi:magnesium transporter [Lipingzhangella sp. LS1_29]|uniref:Magnesium transporter MgtE n=1 Tax=Lipingzhangella rawalii TaxID=2055835 RepID=A0ABU2H6U0_9ACTN|nr:magnesium transporter [Lipingzhangella rawalii]MDS1271015.1 magnesium transporter [Lipingzhangella rawalii]